MKRNRKRNRRIELYGKILLSLFIGLGWFVELYWFGFSKLRFVSVRDVSN